MKHTRRIFVMLLAFPFIYCQKMEITQPTEMDTTSADVMYTMPDEGQPHEGTWLQWPHANEYGATYRNRLDATWVAMTEALASSEKVHIIAYDATEQKRITDLLNKANVALTNIDFKVYPTNDVWVRDNGPVYVKNKEGKNVIEDWGFNGWGKKARFNYCNEVPAKVASDQAISRVDLNTTMQLEGGSIEIDGNGTLMATKSAILNKNRNPSMTQAQAEAILKKNLGVTHFIWLDGVAGLEITDMHIDGFTKFANPTTIVTMEVDDLLEWQVPQKDITTLYDAKDKNGRAYTFIKLPLTKNNVTTTYGKNLGYKGSYINYYIANTVVLVPVYNDVNDAVAIAELQKIYPTKKVVGIDVRNLYAQGGMVHCVTQQQPI